MVRTETARQAVVGQQPSTPRLPIPTSLMGLFSKGKRAASASDVPGWIIKADAAITLARQTHTLKGVDVYLSVSCGADFADSLEREDKEPVGLKRYQKVSWVKENATSWLKCVTYENIALSHRVTVPLGEDYKERWTISETEHKIERMELIYE